MNPPANASGTALDVLQEALKTSLQGALTHGGHETAPVQAAPLAEKVAQLLRGAVEAALKYSPGQRQGDYDREMAWRNMMWEANLKGQELQEAATKLEALARKC